MATDSDDFFPEEPLPLSPLNQGPFFPGGDLLAMRPQRSNLNWVEPPVTPGRFPQMLDAAQKQTEMICWMAEALRDHEERIETLDDRVAAIASSRPRQSISTRTVVQETHVINKSYEEVPVESTRLKVSAIGSTWLKFDAGESQIKKAPLPLAKRGSDIPLERQTQETSLGKDEGPADASDSVVNSNPASPLTVSETEQRPESGKVAGVEVTSTKTAPDLTEVLVGVETALDATNEVDSKPIATDSDDKQKATIDEGAELPEIERASGVQSVELGMHTGKSRDVTDQVRQTPTSNCSATTNPSANTAQQFQKDVSQFEPTSPSNELGSGASVIETFSAIDPFRQLEKKEESGIPKEFTVKDTIYATENAFQALAAAIDARLDQITRETETRLQNISDSLDLKMEACNKLVDRRTRLQRESSSNTEAILKVQEMDRRLIFLEGHASKQQNYMSPRTDNSARITSFNPTPVGSPRLSLRSTLVENDSQVQGQQKTEDSSNNGIVSSEGGTPLDALEKLRQEILLAVDYKFAYVITDFQRQLATATNGGPNAQSMDSRSPRRQQSNHGAIGSGNERHPELQEIPSGRQHLLGQMGQTLAGVSGREVVDPGSREEVSLVLNTVAKRGLGNKDDLDPKLLSLPDDIAGLKRVVADVLWRIPDVENGLLNLKPLQMQLPHLQMSINELSSTVGETMARLTALEGAERSPRQAAQSPSGKIRSTPTPSSHTPQGNRGKFSEEELYSKKLSVKTPKSGSQQPDLKVFPKFEDVEQAIGLIEDRLRELDTDFRVWQRRSKLQIDGVVEKQEAISKEDALTAKAWNLENQVDVIQSVVAQEMRAVKSDLDARFKAHMAEAGGKVGGALFPPDTFQRNLSPSVGAESPLEERVKRLQETSQQNLLKIAGLKTSGRHMEGQMKYSVDRVKSLGAAVDELMEVVQRNELRLDYLVALHRGDCGLPPLPTKSARGGFKRAGTLAMSSAQSSPTRVGGQDEQSALPDREEVRELERLEDVLAIEVTSLRKHVKKVEDDMATQVDALRDNNLQLTTKLTMLISYLPNKQRRMIERLMFKGGASVPSEHDDEDQQKTVAKRKKDGKVSFRYNPDVEEFSSDPDFQVPWNVCGEVPRQWRWCLAPKGEFGAELARHLELMDGEREEFESDIREALKTLEENIRSNSRRGREDIGAYSRKTGGGSSGAAGSRGLLQLPDDNSVDEMRKRSNESVSDHGSRLTERRTMAAFEERLERMQSSILDANRKMEGLLNEKADKDQFDILTLRVTAIEKYDLNTHQQRIETLDRDAKHSDLMMGQLAEQIRKVDSTAATRTEVAKLKGDLTFVKTRVEKTEADIKDHANSLYHSNRKLNDMFTHKVQQIEVTLKHLEKEKATQDEVSALRKTVLILESSLRDNRVLLEGCGTAVSGVLKRMILNMEDKIMVLEKKVNSLAECVLVVPSADSDRKRRFSSTVGFGGHFSASRLDAMLDDGSLPAITDALSPRETQEQLMRRTGSEEHTTGLSGVVSQVQQVKQDLAMCRANVDALCLQNNAQHDLSEKLTAMVESAGENDENVVLSMNRVQVMISMAARQLVANSPWVTREAFDTRLRDARKEYMGSTRQLQLHLNDLATLISRFSVPVGEGKQPPRPFAGTSPTLPSVTGKGTKAIPLAVGDISVESSSQGFTAVDRDKPFLAKPLSARQDGSFRPRPTSLAVSGGTTVGKHAAGFMLKSP